MTAYSYFDLPPDPKELTINNGLVSPLSAPASLQAHVGLMTKRILLSKDLRSRSDQSVLRLDPRIQTIEEELDGRPPATSYTASIQHSHERAVKRGPARPPLRRQLRMNSSKYSSTLQSFRTARTKSSVSSSTNSGIDATPSEKTLSTDWNNRSLTSQAFRTKNTLDTNHESKGSRSDDFTVAAHSYSQLDQTHVIQSKTSTDLSQNGQVEDSMRNLFRSSHADDITVSTSRRSSINPKNLFSTTVEVFRKRRRRSHSPSMEPNFRQQKFRPSHKRRAPGHSSNLRRESTSADLVQVSLMLQDIQVLSERGRTASDETIASIKSQSPDLCDKDDMSNFVCPMGRVKSLELTASETASLSSSLLNLRMGHVPPNTPEERATYTAFNEQGELEEFVKIDISLKGQTSFLPSEARRIHTPPPLSKSRDGRKRGFFFDYSDPQLPYGQPILRREDLTRTETRAKQNGRTLKGHESISCSPQSSGQFPGNVKVGTQAKVGDWYTLQLAELDDSSEDEMDVNDTNRYSACQDVRACPFEAEHHRIEDERRLDHSIPDHLPTSPLCPRHPKYWRLIRQQGSQFRGC